MVLGASEDGQQTSDAFNWGQKLASGSEEMVTLTKTQLQALLSALGEQEQSSIVNHHRLKGPPRLEAKIPPAEDDQLPNWVRRNSVACPASPVSFATGETSPLEELQRSRLSTSHPELGGSVPTRPFSKVAQKQLQWQREKAEMQDWHPWGRPGGGAPRRQPVAAVPPRTEAQVLQVQGTYTSRGRTPPPMPQPLLPGPTSPAFVRRVPPALRSSIPFGPTADPNEEEKEEMRRRWIQELERQKEEQHRRRMIVQQRSSFSNSSWWGDNESTAGSTDMAQRGDDLSDSSVFLRGRGTSQDVQRIDERRQRALEYQRAIQAQVEEKKRREHEEREARLREEREEERRLEEQRRRLAEQYELEQRKQREKAEQEERKRQLLIAKMQEAQAEAEAARKARRGQKLVHLQQQPKEEPEHSQRAVPEAPAVSTALASPVAVDSGIASSDSSTKPLPQAATATVHPMQNCVPSTPSSLPSSNCPSSPLRETSSQTERIPSPDTPYERSPRGFRFGHGPPKYEPYVENRVLTPTKLRIAQRSLGHQAVRLTGREFGTQTDISLPCGWGAAMENAHSSSTASSAVSVPPQQKTCRVQHSRPTRASRNPSGGEVLIERATEGRPQWGVNNPDRVFVKMTDRDPNYHYRKKLQEMRKQHWEREMATKRPLREVVRRTTRVPSHRPPATGHTSRDSSGGWERGRSSSQSPSRSLPSAQTQCTMSNEELNSRDDSTEEAAENDRMVIIRRTSSPPVPALRKMLAQGKDPALLSPSCAQWMLSETSPPPEHEQLPDSPPVRKQWQDQKVYVPSSAVSPLPNAKPKNSIEERAERGRTVRRESKERRRSVSVHGCRPPNPSPPSPDNCPQPPRSSSQDPLVHPEIITGRPTPRQDKILQQLSSLRQGLLLRQRQMENILRKSKT